MDYYKNHCWCSSSHWDNQRYDCQIMVSLSSYGEGYTEDWNNLTCDAKVFSQERFDELMKIAESVQQRYPEIDWVKNLEDDCSTGYVTIRKFKSEVLMWLDNNVEDCQGEKGWCIGSDDYLAGGPSSSLNIFFQRRKDAMSFIKTWSKWKKPINYWQYFTDVRKTLNLETLKYE